MFDLVKISCRSVPQCCAYNSVWALTLHYILHCERTLMVQDDIFREHYLIMWDAWCLTRRWREMPTKIRFCCQSRRTSTQLSFWFSRWTTCFVLQRKTLASTSDEHSRYGNRIVTRCGVNCFFCGTPTPALKNPNSDSDSRTYCLT